MGDWTPGANADALTAIVTSVRSWTIGGQIPPPCTRVRSGCGEPNAQSVACLQAVGRSISVGSHSRDNATVRCSPAAFVDLSGRDVGLVRKDRSPAKNQEANVIGAPRLWGAPPRGDLEG